MNNSVIVTLNNKNGSFIGHVVEETKNFIILEKVIKLNIERDEYIPPFDIFHTDRVKFMLNNIEYLTTDINDEVREKYNKLKQTFYN